MRVLVVGDVAVDVLVTPSASVAPGADVPARIRTRPGGAGANTAVWLAQLVAAVILAARVGDDAPGHAAAASLRAAGVTPHVAVDRDALTATVVALLTNAERTLLSDRGAAARLAPSDLPPLDGVTHVHVSGYVLLDPLSRAAGLAALAAARVAGASTSVDPQAAPALGPAFLRDVSGIDLLLPNAEELSALGGEAAALRYVRTVATTHGAAGATWADVRGHWSVSAPQQRVQDATGAGDAFNAGVLMAWLRGKDPPTALKAGCAAAAAALAQEGARP